MELLTNNCCQRRKKTKTILIPNHLLSKNKIQCLAATLRGKGRTIRRICLTLLLKLISKCQKDKWLEQHFKESQNGIIHSCKRDIEKMKEKLVPQTKQKKCFLQVV
jgi:hypothetical protein